METASTPIGLPLARAGQGLWRNIYVFSYNYSVLSARPGPFSFGEGWGEDITSTPINHSPFPVPPVLYPDGTTVPAGRL